MKLPVTNMIEKIIHNRVPEQDIGVINALIAKYQIYPGKSIKIKPKINSLLSAGDIRRDKSGIVKMLYAIPRTAVATDGWTGPITTTVDNFADISFGKSVHRQYLDSLESDGTQENIIYQIELGFTAYLGKLQDDEITNSLANFFTDEISEPDEDTNIIPVMDKKEIAENVKSLFSADFKPLLEKMYTVGYEQIFENKFDMELVVSDIVSETVMNLPLEQFYDELNIQGREIHSTALIDIANKLFIEDLTARM